MAGERAYMGEGWKIPESLPELAAGAVQVWRLRLRESASSRQELRALLDCAYATLTLAERERAARMRAGAPREEFVAGRGCLRRLLAAQLAADGAADRAADRAADPRTLLLETGAHGKPRLGLEANLDFNIAHSGGVVLLALSRAGAVGVDIEYIDTSAELSDVARTAFHASDVEQIDRADSQDGRLAEFYRCWTRKEAVLKADGRGLSGDLAFAVGRSGAISLGGRTWCVRELDAGMHHRAALATEREETGIELLELSPASPLLFVE